MCGIAGVAGQPGNKSQLQAMGQAMAHRGPDDQGTYCDQAIGLSFRRLAIVDLEGGRQPMSNENGTIQVIFNGEIYDHDHLRKDLEANGHRFVTDHSDTEVLVHGWEQWQEGLFPRLNGMFGVAIWDQKNQKLILARDRYGIKPLYYSLLPNGTLIFGSEIKAILASGLLEAQPCPEALMEYFSFQNVWRKQTMYQGVQQLEPGTILTWQNGRVQEEQYWDLTFPRKHRGSFQSCTEEHRSILQRAIRRQLAADVPVKTYLSGGIDSTAISVVSHQLDPTMTAYSCIFNLDEVGDDRQVDERQYSRQVAETYQMQRVELELSPTSLQECMHRYAWALEDLRMGMGYPVYLIAQRVARDAKVVLSGTGGDELHAGYVGRYQALGLSSDSHRLSWLGKIKEWLATKKEPPGPDPDWMYRRMLNSWFQPGEWQQTFTPEFLRQSQSFNLNGIIDSYLARCPSDDWRDRVLYVDAKTYLHGLLVMEDKLSMAHSLEARVPLLDNELVDFVLKVPFEMLWKGEVGKRIFRESVRPWVPESIYTKPKMGFGPPDASWYRGPLRPWIEEMLKPLVRDERGIFQGAAIRRLLDDHWSGERNHYHLIWSLLNFESWCQVNGFYGAKPARSLSA